MTSPSVSGIVESPLVMFKPPLTGDKKIFDLNLLTCKPRPTFFSFFQLNWSRDKPDPHRYLVDGVVDVKGSWTRQSPLPPTKASLPARSRPPETEALGASFRIVHRQTERTFLASIALPSNRVFLTNEKKNNNNFKLLQNPYFFVFEIYLPYKGTVPRRRNRKSRGRSALYRPRCNRTVDTWGNRSTLSRTSRT